MRLYLPPETSEYSSLCHEPPHYPYILEMWGLLGVRPHHILSLTLAVTFLRPQNTILGRVSCIANCLVCCTLISTRDDPPLFLRVSQNHHIPAIALIPRPSPLTLYSSFLAERVPAITRKDAQKLEKPLNMHFYGWLSVTHGVLANVIISAQHYRPYILKITSNQIYEFEASLAHWRNTQIIASVNENVPLTALLVYLLDFLTTMF